MTIAKVTKTEDAIGRRNDQFLGVLTSPANQRWEHIRAAVEQGQLTTRQRELYEHLLAGGSVRGFASAYDISEHTADFHWRKLKEKLGIQSPRDISKLREKA